MKTEPSKYALYLGATMIGHIIPTEEDFPWFYGKFIPSAAFHSVSKLFKNELRLLQETKGGEAWEKAYDAISAIGLRLEPLHLGEVIRNPLLHIKGEVVWWR